MHAVSINIHTFCISQYALLQIWHTTFYYLFYYQSGLNVQYGHNLAWSAFLIVKIESFNGS